MMLHNPAPPLLRFVLSALVLVTLTVYGLSLIHI